MIKKKRFNYYLTFQLMADTACSCALELMKVLKNYDPSMMEAHLQTMHHYENDADQRKHDVLSALAKDNRPPFEHEDIAALCNALDDVVDMVEDVSIGLHIYNIKEIKEDAQAYGKVIVKCCDAVSQLMKAIEKMEYNEKVEDYRWGDDPKDTYEVLPAETVKKYLPEGYELVEGIYSVAGGETQDSYFVYAEVKKVLVEETQDVKINYYDEAAGKQVAEVPVQVSIDTSCVNMAILTRYLPEGYTLEGSDCIIRDGYVYVSVAPAEEVQNVKINYYDEAAKKQVAEVPVQVSIDTSCVNMAILTRYMPEGYALVSSDCIIRDGYVYVSVKKDVEIREAVLHITFETPNGEVVTTETVTAEGADGEDAVFRLGVDFNLPTGYKLSNDRDQVTEITIPFGSTGGHTMVVEKGDLSSIVKIQFVDAENNDEVVAGGDYFVDGDGDGIFHTREITEWVPEGYELQEVGDFQVELYKETPLQLSVTKIKEDKPETPDPEEPNKPEKPEDPDKEDTNNKDDKKEDTKKEDKKKNSPKTGDETSAAAAALPAGVSLAAILAVLVKKFK